MNKMVLCVVAIRALSGKASDQLIYVSISAAPLGPDGVKKNNTIVRFAV
jgi:hypothetical protein